MCSVHVSRLASLASLNDLLPRTDLDTLHAGDFKLQISVFIALGAEGLRAEEAGRALPCRRFGNHKSPINWRPLIRPVIFMQGENLDVSLCGSAP